MRDTPDGLSTMAHRYLRSWLVRRIGQSVLVVWLSFTGAFVALYAMPSDPVVLMLAQRAGEQNAVVDAAQVAELRAEYGFDRPVWEQYLAVLGGALRGDFGASVQNDRSVTTLIVEALGQTAPLAGLALLLALAFGIGLPLLGAATRGSALRWAAETMPVLGVSLPAFWVGLVLLQLLSFGIPLFPATGDAGFAGLVLPAITIALPTGSVLAQVFGRSLRRTLAEPHIELAQAKGASRGRVLVRHGLRNASAPLVALSGVVLGHAFAGAVVVETIFGRNGLGRVTVDAVTNQDLPVVLGLVVFTGLLFVLVSFAVDAVTRLLDPRIRR